MGTCKRWPVLPKALLEIHRNLSKATLHEALLDLWLEHHGMDIHPSDLDDLAVGRFVDEIVRRAEARRRQG